MFDRNQWRREQYQLNPEPVKQYNREKYLAHPERRMAKSAEARAKKKGIECIITKEDIVIPDLCPYLGTPLDYSGGQDTVPSLDRIDCGKGYTPDNIRVISNLANSMKREATAQQLRRFAESVLRLH